jgi:hypothetical protein
MFSLCFPFRPRAYWARCLPAGSASSVPVSAFENKQLKINHIQRKTSLLRSNDYLNVRNFVLKRTGANDFEHHTGRRTPHQGGDMCSFGFRQWCHGYVVTSHKAQGWTADHVVVAAERLTAKGAYVACSRGRHSCISDYRRARSTGMVFWFERVDRAAVCRTARDAWHRRAPCFFAASACSP